MVVLVDGRPGYEAFGHVELGGPMRRNPEFLAPVWIIDPQEEQIHFGRASTMTGSGVSPDSILQWKLSPGEYQVSVFELADHGERVNADTREFTGRNAEGSAQDQ